MYTITIEVVYTTNRVFTSATVPARNCVNSLFYLKSEGLLMVVDFMIDCIVIPSCIV